MIGIFKPALRQILREPREAAETVLSLGFPRDALWPAFWALVITSTLINYAAGGPAGPDGKPFLSPFELAALSGLGGMLSVFAIWKFGEFLGGSGKFQEALLLTVFLQSILVLAQVIEFGLLMLVPPLAGLYSIAVFIFAVWLNINFIAALHGFASRWRALGVLVLSSVLIAATLLFAMRLAGVSVGG